jgi:predicted  nucleic acid-binding Zn-ribbon protein
MLGYLTLPVRLLGRAFDDLHAIAQAAAAIPRIERRIEDLRRELEDMPEHVDGLRDAFEGSNREVHEVGERMGPLTEELRRLRAEVTPRLGQMQEELGDVADVVEPLEPAAERLGRLANRLPGGRSRD